MSVTAQVHTGKPFTAGTVADQLKEMGDLVPRTLDYGPRMVPGTSGPRIVSSLQDIDSQNQDQQASRSLNSHPRQ